MDFNQIFLTGGMLCSIGKSIFGSTYSFLWSAITYLGFFKCFLIIIVIILWIIWEIGTRYKHSYNSENGFTPIFNSFVGASIYFWSQEFIYISLEKFFTEAVYCFKWPYILHVSIFIFTGLLLNITGFWRYWKFFGHKIRIR